MNIDLDEKISIKKAKSFVRVIKRTVSWIGKKASYDAEMREEYHLMAKDGYHQSKTMLLNGTPLEIAEDGGIPPLNPSLVAVNSPLSVAPMSIVFVVLPKFEARACA